MKKTSKKSKNSPQIERKIPLPKGNQLMAIAGEFNGGSRLRVLCEDGEVRMGRIPGKLKRRMWIKEGDLLIVEPWVVQSKEKCDIKYRYTKTQRIRLNLKNRIPVILQGLNI